MDLRAQRAVYSLIVLAVIMWGLQFVATTYKNNGEQNSVNGSQFQPIYTHLNMTGAQFQPSDVVIAVITSNKNAAKIRAIAATWASRHNGVNILYFNARDAIKDPSLADPGEIAEHPYNKSVTLEYPASQVIALDVDEDHTHKITRKTMNAFAYMWEHYSKCKWFMKVDDDTYVVIENYLRMLANYDVNKPTALGYVLWDIQFSGGAGYTLSSSAMERVVKMLPDCNQRMGSWAEPPGEDTMISKCLTEVGVNLTHVPGHFFDSPYQTYNNWVEPHWATLTEFPLTFHYAKPNHMFAIDYLLHYAKVYH